MAGYPEQAEKAFGAVTDLAKGLAPYAEQQDAYRAFGNLVLGWPELLERTAELARVAAAARNDAGPAYDVLLKIFQLRPELAEKPGDFIGPFRKIKTGLGRQAKYIFKFYPEMLAVRPDLAEKLDDFTGLFSKSRLFTGDEAEVASQALGEFITAQPALAEKIKELISILTASKKAWKRSYEKLKDIITLEPKLKTSLVENMQDLAVLAERFGNRTDFIYGILHVMVKEGLLAEDNFDQVVQELLNNGEKALLRLKEQVNVA